MLDRDGRRNLKRRKRVEMESLIEDVAWKIFKSFDVVWCEEWWRIKKGRAGLIFQSFPCFFDTFQFFLMVYDCQPIRNNQQIKEWFCPRPFFQIHYSQLKTIYLLSALRFKSPRRTSVPPLDMLLPSKLSPWATSDSKVNCKRQSFTLSRHFYASFSLNGEERFSHKYHFARRNSFFIIHWKLSSPVGGRK